MATPSSVVGEMLSLTMYNRSKTMADGISKNVPFFRELKDNTKIISGGESILEPQLFAETAGTKWYSGSETLNTGHTEQFTSFRFQFKQFAAAVVVNGLEVDVQNTGKEQLFDLVEQRLQAAEYTTNNAIAASIESDGTGDGGRQIGGLGLLVSSAPTSGTVGGIDRATYTFARNAFFDASVDMSITLASSNIASWFGYCMDNLTRGDEKPNLIYCGGTHFRWYRESLQGLQQFVTLGTDGKAVSSLGGGGLELMGAKVMNGGGYQGVATATVTRFLNTNHIFFKTAKNRNFVPLKARDSFNQDVTVRYLAWAGNMTFRNAFLHGYGQA